MINIVADENLAYPEELFSRFGKVTLVNGRKISNTVLKNADVLIIRSVTEVNESLLDGTSVKFVGSATIGTDHIDIEYLRKRKIAFSAAPGCNSYAVAEYVITALLNYAVKYGIMLKDKSIGIVGIGNIGKKVAAFCESFGMTVLKNDPPLYRQGKLPESCSLDEILGADIISLHTPLTFIGQDKTFQLFDEKKLTKLKDNTVLLNTARGSIVDNTVLPGLINKKNLCVIFDVWENEPRINSELVEKVFIGTPHVAGYTFEGKINGSLYVFDALAKFLDTAASPDIQLPAIPKNEYKLISRESGELTLIKMINSIYNIKEDNERLKKSIELNTEARGDYFDKLRKEYPLRREFNNYTAVLESKSKSIQHILETLRFSVRSV